MISVDFSPIIIIGMHRSGTSLLAKALKDSGLFIGTKIEENSESIFFRKINNWLLHQSSATWDYPAPIYNLLNNDTVRAMSVEYIKTLMNMPHIIEFTGLKKYIANKCSFPSYKEWGWKDPRNTFTLPIWLDIFPEAKIVHIRRHGTDVAQSLLLRYKANLATAQRLNKKRRFLYYMYKKKGGFLHTLRCSTLYGGISLWEEYMREANHHVKNLGKRALSIKYEDFLECPREILASLLNFCNLSPNINVIQKIEKSIDTGKAYKYQGDSRLRFFSNSMEGRLKNYGY